MSKKNTDPTILQGNLVRVSQPATLSLVGLPANSRPFKVVRSDKGTVEEAAEGKTTRRVRRSAQNPILRLAFTEMEPDAMHQILKDYGMEDYTISTEDGVVVATRSDLQTFAKEGTESILLQRGVTAFIEPQVRKTKRGDERRNIKVAAFEFDAARHDADSVQAWLTSHNIDITATAPENPDACFVAQRSEVAEGVEARRMEIEDGVIAVIVLDETLDVPAGVIEVIAEAAYGNWGWGQLDFNARLADRDFCRAMDDAIYILQDTLYSLVFYSDLPLDVRQTLITNALTQFNDYVTTKMSVLPRQVLVAVARADSRKEKTAVTTTATTAAQEPAVVRNDTTAAPAAIEGAQAPAATTTEAPAARADETITLTPAELEERIQAEIAKRAAPAAEGAAAAAAVTTTETPPAEEEPTLASLLTRMDALTTANVALAAKVDALAAKPADTTVVVRSDTAGNESALNKTPEVQRADPWAGMFTGGKK